ncbi:sigma-70 family RNA polymerase sigma factor [Belliella sp. DSM 111904]|uniref:Sigma-70 family RNA polymerase sigma factor n=1 Tax=Belliella filtrata TaxID=2923435 RepID=A0ABS9UZD4_9BACT|nr:sigma-70 family RNA polymerase sigma factor [Belliella filtrata]MCH7409474.1 sigma-70 family RNA polymerase sigma factor [Belliella filtrata]
MMDNNLLERLSFGDTTALEEIYRKYREPFIQFASKYHADKNQICDIYQDVIIALFEKVKKKKLQLTTGSLKTYVFSMGKFMLFSRLKKNANTEFISNDNDYFEGLADYHDFLDEKDPQVILIENGIASLGKKCQELLRLFYYEEKKLSEIQEILNYNHTDVVKSQKSRCLKSLRSSIELNQDKI